MSAPIPPAVVGAMASVIRDWNDRYLTFPTELIHAALSAALATGSVVICTPELKALMDAAKALSYASLSFGSEDYSADIGVVIEAALAFTHAHQEDKG